jgi:hypothetical protein
VGPIKGFSLERREGGQKEERKMLMAELPV